MESQDRQLTLSIPFLALFCQQLDNGSWASFPTYVLLEISFKLTGELIWLIYNLLPFGPQPVRFLARVFCSRHLSPWAQAVHINHGRPTWSDHSLNANASSPYMHREHLPSSFCTQPLTHSGESGVANINTPPLACALVCLANPLPFLGLCSTHS